MSWSLCGAAFVRSRLRVTANARAARSSVRSGCNLTFHAGGQGGEASASADQAAAWDASGWAGGEGVVNALAVTGGGLTGRTWLVALGSATDSGTPSGCGSASSGPTGA